MVEAQPGWNSFEVMPAFDQPLVRASTRLTFAGELAESAQLGWIGHFSQLETEVPDVPFLSQHTTPCGVAVKVSVSKRELNRKRQFPAICGKVKVQYVGPAVG